MEDLDRKGELGGAYKYASLGMQFAGGTLLFAGVGFLLDRWLGILPALTVAGLLVGGALSFYSVYRRVLGDGRTAGRQDGTKQRPRESGQDKERPSSGR